MKPHFHMKAGRDQVVRPRTGVQQGCISGNSFYSTRVVALLLEFRRNPSLESAIICAYTDDVTGALPREKARDMTLVAHVTRWLQIPASE